MNPTNLIALRHQQQCTTIFLIMPAQSLPTVTLADIQIGSTVWTTGIAFSAADLGVRATPKSKSL